MQSYLTECRFKIRGKLWHRKSLRFPNLCLTVYWSWGFSRPDSLHWHWCISYNIFVVFTVIRHIKMFTHPWKTASYCQIHFTSWQIYSSSGWWYLKRNVLCNKISGLFPYSQVSKHEHYILGTMKYSLFEMVFMVRYCVFCTWFTPKYLQC